jgi:hypothetical protein
MDIALMRYYKKLYLGYAIAATMELQGTGRASAK